MGKVMEVQMVKMYDVTRLTLFSAVLAACSGDVGPERTSVFGAPATDPGATAGVADTGGAMPGSGQIDMPMQPGTATTGGTNGDPMVPPTQPPGVPPPAEEDAGADPNVPPPPAASCALMAGLRLSEVSLYQAVKIPLMQAGALVAITQRKAPVVQGRQALVRLFVTPESGFTSRSVLGRLTLNTGGVERVYDAEKTVSGTSTDANKESTINLVVDAQDIGPDTTFSAQLLQPGATCSGAAGQAGVASFPATGTVALSAKAVGGLRVVVVPITLNNGLTGEAGDSAISLIRNAFITQFPITDIELEMHAPVTINATLGATDQNSWSNVLSQLGKVRSDERPEQDVYYFGLMRPASSFGTFCNRGCISGIAPLNSSDFGGGAAGSSSQRYGIGLGFGDKTSADTMVHEIGHAAGLPHAPCGGVSSADSQFPYSGGAIGSWGYDSIALTLKDPARNTDFMGYCDSTWVSDYNYNKLATRQGSINGNAYIIAGPESTYRTLLVGGDGSVQWGAELTSSGPPGGVPETALLRSDDGDWLEEVTVYRTPLSHTDGFFVYVESELGTEGVLSVQGAREIAMGTP